MSKDMLYLSWKEIDEKRGLSGDDYHKLVYVDLLYRAYIGIAGIPGRRYLAIEIPEADKDKISSIKVSKGFTIKIAEPIISHPGFIACVLQATAYDLNDIFSILTEDILNELLKERVPERYIDVLKERIEKWRDFFKSASNALTEEKAIGLVGELSCLKELERAGIKSVGYWNGPIKAAQDFQSNCFAIEVKTTKVQQLNSVKISSEIQLDHCGRDELFLVVYQIEENKTRGETLPELVKSILCIVSEHDGKLLEAKLLCMGYLDDGSEVYQKRYCIKQRCIYHIVAGFPRIIKEGLPKGISNVEYALSLSPCSDYMTTAESALKRIGDCCNG